MIAQPSELPSSLDAITRLYESGRYATAYRTASRSGILDVDRNTSPEQVLVAARVLRATGAPRRARKLLLEAWRRHRRHAGLTVFAIYELLNTSPFTALQWIERTGELADASAEERGEWSCARALCMSELRDFSAAVRAWQEAREVHTDAWTWCVKALIDDTRDRKDDALAAVERARELSPWYRPAIEVAARMLVRTRRPSDARALLAEASTHLEAASTQQILAMLQRDAGELDAAIESLHRAVAWSPAMERDVHDQLASELGFTHYLRGDVELGVHLMRLSQHELTRTIAERIETTRGVRRLLPVPHVPQHHMTCAPATLTAIAEHWGERVDHVEIAEEICHDGTPAGNERKWAEEHGFVVRQFTVTWDAVKALVDAGIPIALTTSYTIGAHLQPVAGYDERRRSLLVRDPSMPVLVDYDWERLATAQAPFGPRGMAFVPASRRAALDAIELPDSALYEHLFAIEMALQRHDRAAARAAYEALAAAAPGDHYLLHQARRALASYDGDERGTIAWVMALRERHADHPWLRMCELGSLHGHASDERRAELANGLLADHRDDPGILVACGRFLYSVGEMVRARAIAHRAIQIAPQLAPAYQLAADVAWTTGERSKATRLYRIASCLAEGDESAAWSYFIASLITGEADAALEYLRDRVARMQSRSGAPARTLCEAFAAIGRAAEGLSILEAAIAEHPDDGTLLLVAADHHRLSGDVTQATRYLELARGKAADPMWRRCAAAIAMQRGDVEEALALRRQLVDDEPLDLQSQQAYVALLVQSGALAAAREHVLATCAKFPFHIPLAQLCHAVLCDRDPETARAQLEAFVERQPRCAWASRQLAEWHLRRGDLATARELLARARSCSDDLASVEVLEAALDTRDGRRDDAMAHLLAAIRIDVDAAGAVGGLLDLARDADEARGLLDTVAGELARQGSGGPGLLAYATYVQRCYDPLTALERLRAVRVARAYQWSAWFAELDALLGAGRVDEAAALATEATQRFGNDSRAWRQLAIIESVRGNQPAARTALERALELDPHSTELMRRLSDTYLAEDDLARAREVIERALAEEPLGEINHGYLARVAKLQGDTEAALRHLLRAVELAPEYGWAWDRLLEWSDDERVVFAAARRTLERESAAMAPRLLLAQFAHDLTMEQRLELIDEGIRIAPDRTDFHDAKAEMLARHERWDEALAACRPAFWGDEPPLVLRGRAAWVRFQRGEHEAAIDDMLAAIRRAPSYGWGIEQLIAWGKRIGAPVRTAERLAAAAPESAFAHAALGEARREAGDLEGAEAAFARALELDGTQHLARLGLFDVRFEQKKYDAAEPLLVELDGENAYVMARRVQIRAVTGRLDEADAELERMLRRGIAEGTPIEEAITGYRIAKAEGRVDTLLDRLMGEPDATRAIAIAWWDHRGRFLGRGARWRRIKRWPESEATSLAAGLHVESYENDLLGLFGFLCLNYRHARRRTSVWGAVGYCLYVANCYWFVRWWLADHETRPGVAPWMLVNLSRALAAHGAITRAIEVCRRALELPPDHATHRLLLLLAPVEAMEDPDTASRALSAARRVPWSGDDRFLGQLAEAVIAYSKSARDSEARAELTRALGDVWDQHRGAVTELCHRVFEFVTTAIARTLGDAQTRWLRKVRGLPGGF